MPLNEVELRKPGFREGYALMMADGQRWHIPKPRIRVKLLERENESSILQRPAFGDAYEQSIDILFGVEEATNWKRLETRFKLMAALLRENYELTPQNVSELLILEVDDEKSDERWEEVEDALLGIQPKI